jgi:hypothetical protein
MIFLDMPAKLRCDEAGCEVRLDAELLLKCEGTFAFKLPLDHGWQVMVSQQGLYMTRCPAHHATLTRLTPPSVHDTIGELIEQSKGGRKLQ